MTPTEPPRNSNQILLAALIALLAGTGAIVVVALLAHQVLR
jgi:hypothetical protein